MTDFKSKASCAGSEKDRLFQDKMDLNNKFQQLLVNKEQSERVCVYLYSQIFISPSQFNFILNFADSECGHMLLDSD